MVCLRNISVDILHKGETDDDDDHNNNINGKSRPTDGPKLSRLLRDPNDQGQDYRGTNVQQIHPLGKMVSSALNKLTYTSHHITTAQ
jgi:hypothetical protein